MTAIAIAIRSATAADLPLILRFIRGLAEYENLLDQVVATEDTLRQSLFGPQPAAEVLIGMVDGAPAGFAVFLHTFSTFLGRRGLYLEDLFVHPAFRGQGLGEALLRRVAQLARERGCGRLEWTVLDWNQPAIRFYEGRGATVLPDWRVCRIAAEALAQLAGPPPAGSATQ